MIKHILSSDILIADVMIPLEYKRREELEKIPDPVLRSRYKDIETLDASLRKKYEEIEAKLDRILKEKNVQRGQKVALTCKEFEELSRAVAGVPTNGTEPGGSSANTLTTLGKLLGEHVDIEFLGVVEQGLHSNIIRDGLDQAGIRLVSRKSPEGVAPQSALSFVFTDPNGTRTIATYPGNARSILTPEMVTQDMINKSDVVFVQGSLWEKFDRQMVDKLVHERWQNDKEIWLALPTHAKFSDHMPPEAYRYLIPSADVVLGNQEELMRIYETPKFDEAMSRLQQALDRRDDIKREEGKRSEHKAIAFITRGEEGAVVLTAHKPPEYVRAVRPPEGEKIYTLGAGDTSFAGFLAGHIAGLHPKASAQLGMELASAKLAHNSARLPDPLETVRQGSKAIKALFSKVESNLGLPQRNGQATVASR